jgi:hypothetical protein
MTLTGLWTKQIPHRPVCDRKWVSMVTDRRLHDWAKARPLKSSNIRSVYLTSCIILCFRTTASTPLFFPIIYSNHTGRRWTTHNERNQLHTQLTTTCQLLWQLQQLHLCNGTRDSSVTTREIWSKFLTSEIKSVSCWQPTWMWVHARVGSDWRHS